MRRIIELGFAVLIVFFIFVGVTRDDFESVRPNKTLMSFKTEIPADTDKKSNVQPGIINIPNAFDIVGKPINDQNNNAKSEANNMDNPETEKGSLNKSYAQNEKSSSGDYDIRNLNPQKPMVALTFDDGPHPRYTTEILEALKKNDGLATFFIIGSRAEKYPNVVKSITKNGNQLGNHTYDHKELTKLNKSGISSEINKTAGILEGITGLPPHITRPTYGSVDDKVRMYAGSPLILWSIDTQDWKTRNKDKIIHQALKRVKDGDIILMHDIYKTTADAAKVIIKELKDKGFQLVTINELYQSRGIGLENGKEYFKCPPVLLNNK